jgi:hypothetical protein
MTFIHVACCALVAGTLLAHSPSNIITLASIGCLINTSPYYYTHFITYMHAYIHQNKYLYFFRHSLHEFLTLPRPLLLRSVHRITCLIYIYMHTTKAKLSHNRAIYKYRTPGFPSIIFHLLVSLRNGRFDCIVKHILDPPSGQGRALEIPL